MIDWLSGKIAIRGHSIMGGKMLKISPDGEVEWLTECFTDVKGSYDQNFRLRALGPNDLYFSGNPAKWLQGHNLFGSDDLESLLYATMQDLLSRLGVQLNGVDLAASVAVATLTRVDVTRSFSLGTRAAVLNFLKAASEQAYLSHRGRGSLVNEGTLYFGKESRRWSVKFYCKGEEVDAHRLNARLPRYDDLKAWADDQLRVEVTLRGMELSRLNLNAPIQWRDNAAERAFTDKLSGLTMSGQYSIPAQQIAKLPPRLRAAYQLWRDGHDLRRVYTRPTFYRYRSFLLGQGVDIAVVRDRRASAEKADLRQVMTAVQSPIPAWALGTPLYFEPAKLAA